MRSVQRLDDSSVERGLSFLDEIARYSLNPHESVTCRFKTHDINDVYHKWYKEIGIFDFINP